jgi:preprotein translocase subunit SecY
MDNEEDVLAALKDALKNDGSGQAYLMSLRLRLRSSPSLRELGPLLIKPLTSCSGTFQLREEIKAILTEISQNLLRGHWSYYAFNITLILFFSYFWVSVMFKPIQIADDLKKYGGYIPGVRPGEPTAQFLDFIMTRLTLAGAIFLTVIAVMPDVLLFELDVPSRIAYFFGGTGMLITVGVILDTMRQIETFLLQRHYDGFLKKGRIRGRTTSANVAIGEAASDKSVMQLTAVMVIILLVGLTAWAVRHFAL